MTRTKDGYFVARIRIPDEVAYAAHVNAAKLRMTKEAYYAQAIRELNERLEKEAVKSENHTACASSRA